MLRHAAKLVVIAMLFASCKQNDNDQWAGLVKRLHNSNILLRNFNDQTLWALEDVMHRTNPSSNDFLCVNNGTKANQLTSDLLGYIEKLESDLSKEKGRQLYDRLVVYKQDLLKLMQPGRFPGTTYYEENKKRLFKALSVLDFITDSAALLQAPINAQKWVDENFGSADSVMAHTSLLKIKNDILSSEQVVLKHLRDCTAVLICGNFEKYSAIVGLNSSYIKPGDTIEVTAGIGEFTAASKPDITINGEKIKLNVDAYATYKLRPTGKPGNYSIPVEIEFYKPDGTREKLIRNLHYTIAQ